MSKDTRSHFRDAFFSRGYAGISFAPSKSPGRAGRGGDIDGNLGIQTVTLLDIVWERDDGELMIFDMDWAQLQSVAYVG